LGISSDDGNISLSRNLLSEQRLKGVIVSNERGDIYFEKVFDEGDRAGNFEMNFKRNIEDILHVSLIESYNNEVDYFKINTYFDVKNGVRWSTKK